MTSMNLSACVVEGVGIQPICSCARCRQWDDSSESSLSPESSGPTEHHPATGHCGPLDMDRRGIVLHICREDHHEQYARCCGLATVSVHYETTPSLNGKEDVLHSCSTLRLFLN